ncbi:MAG: DUF4861 domain-containing protein [Opitutus sp.]
MHLLRSLFLAHSLGAAVATSFAASLTVVVSHDLGAPRPAETITLPWAEVTKALPGALLQKIEVRDQQGHTLPYQVTNIAPEAKDPTGAGRAYGDLIFQHDFVPGEKSATFTVNKIDAVAPVFPSRVFARYIPERLDDFAWENDKVAHRTYGPALAEPAAPGSGKEVLVTSGLDVWCKRVSYPVVDRWYNKGHDHYHKDEGEGMDMYQVGTSRGCGGTGIWNGAKLFPGRNYKSWKILANGPIRAIFELTYDRWDADATSVTETKRFTVDVGHHFDQIESTFIADQGSAEFMVGIGLNKNNADKGQEPHVAVVPNAEAGSLAQWTTQKTNGSLGTAIIVPPANGFREFAADAVNELVIASVKSGQPLRYYVGAGWSKAGDFNSQKAWTDYVAAYAQRVTSPIHVTLTSTP